MAAWEAVSKGQVGRSLVKGWYDVPAVRFSKHGTLYLNPRFCEAFQVQQDTELLILLDRIGRKLGIKILPKGTRDEKAFTVRMKDRTKSAFIQCSAIHKAFPDGVQIPYRASLNAGERVIEVLVSTENKVV